MSTCHAHVKIVAPLAPNNTTLQTDLRRFVLEERQHHVAGGKRRPSSASSRYQITIDASPVYQIARTLFFDSPMIILNVYVVVTSCYPKRGVNGRSVDDY